MDETGRNAKCLSVIRARLATGLLLTLLARPSTAWSAGTLNRGRT
jgi:hypothetical protein